MSRLTPNAGSQKGMQMALQPDMRRVMFREQNVNIPAGIRADAACDLSLYFEHGKGIAPCSW